MSGDLSLSQSLGGLRIANPDDDAPENSSPLQQVHSPASRPPPPSSRSSDSTVTGQASLLPVLSHESSGQDYSLGFDPDTYSLQETYTSPASALRPRSPTSPVTDSPRTRLNHRQSMPFVHPQQQQFQYQSPPSSYSSSMHNPHVLSASTRPMSGIGVHPNNSSSSNLSSQGSYRYRDDLYASDGMTGGVVRSGSRSTRSPMSGVPAREPSRTYRQPSTQSNSGNGMIPPRRNSRRSRAPTAGSVGPAGYDSNEPYAGSAPVPRSADEWRDRGAAVIPQRDTDAPDPKQARSAKKGVRDFNFGRTLGEGSYSTVLAATDRQNSKEYAIKVLDKRHIIREKKVKYVNIERDTLNRLTEHPGIVRLYYTFQDERSLYFVLDLASSGELLGVLKKMGSFDVDCTRFYGAEILDSIAYMHSRGVIHRDLKPENVLLDREMHTKITDFGTAKILPNPRSNSTSGFESAGHPSDGAETDRANSFVGTAEYVSPELLRDKNACKASDLWAFGCIVYQLLAGRPPFKAANEYLTFQKILGLEYSFPPGFPEHARDLVERLLVLDPAKRLPIEHIKNHSFFEGIQWGKNLWRQKPPRLSAHNPPTTEPIRLNGGGSNQHSSQAPAAAAAAAMQMSGQSSSQLQGPPRRPQLQTVRDLPPPSQLDIDWSPVLTNNNERILKLGNLVVTTAPPPNSPTGKNGEAVTPSEKPKFTRFFSGTNGKRRERLVLITSSARLVIAPAGGNEKKSKMEVNLIANSSSCKSAVDAKGLTYWSLDSREKHFTFEDPRATTSDPAGSKYSTQEWLDAIEQAREIAIAASMTSSYSGDSILNDVNATSNLSSPSDSLGGDAAMPMSGPSVGDRHTLRHTLRKNTDEESLKGRKRFSKRHSKSGFAAVF